MRRCRCALADRVVIGGAAGRRAGRSGVLDRIGHEPVVTAVDGPDDPLISAGVAHGTACGLDPAGQRRLGDEPVTPDLVEKLGLRHHPLAIAQQIGQHVEDLGFHIDDLAGPSQLDTLDAQLAIAESDLHVDHGAP